MGWGRAGRKGGIALAMALVFALLVAPGCKRAPPEQRLRDTVAQLQHSIEQRDAGAVSEALAADFVGPDSLDRDGVRRMAQLLFLRHAKVGTTVGPLDVRMQGEHATVRFTAALTGGDGAVLPDAARMYEVETGWREVEGEWQLISAEWTAKL